MKRNILRFAMGFFGLGIAFAVLIMCIFKGLTILGYITIALMFIDSLITFNTYHKLHLNE